MKRANPKSLKPALIFSTLILASLPAFASSPQCKGDGQPFGEFCITKAMSDFLACVTTTGGNKSELTSIVEREGHNNNAAAASGSVSTKGKLVAGGVSLELSHKDELSIVDRVQERYFANGATVCAQYARAIERHEPAHHSPHFPLTRTSSGERVVFFDDFVVSVGTIASFGDSGIRVELDTPENGRVRLVINGAPIDVSYKGENYRLSAKPGSEVFSPILVLSQ